MAEAASASASSALTVEVVTPAGPVLRTTCNELVAPGAKGEFGILPGHVPFLSALRTGVLIIHGTQPTQLAIGPGFLEVGINDKILVLTESAESPDKIDVAATKEEITRLEEELKSWQGDENSDYHLLQAKLAWAEAKVAASSRSTTH